MNEYKRVFVNRYWIALMLLFIVVSSGLYIDARSHDGTFSGAKSLAHSYVENLKTYDKMDVPSAIEALEGKQAELSAYSAVSNWYGQKDSNPEYYNMVKEAYLEKYPEIVAMAEAGTLIFDAEEAKIELLVAPQLIAQYKHIESYPGELEEIHNRSKQLLQFSIFNQEDSYSQRNILKTSKDFSSIEGSNITNGKDLAITSIFDGNFLNYAVFAAAFAPK